MTVLFDNNDYIIDLLMLDLNMASLLPLLVTCVTSTCVSYAFYGTESMFSFSIDRVFSIHAIPACIMLGVFCGLVSLYFSAADWSCFKATSHAHTVMVFPAGAEETLTVTPEP